MNGYNLVRLQPKQVLKTGDTMTGNLTMTGGAKFIGDLTGNADTATRLQTARQINGTAFNGTANITTANWGTSRNITIGNTAKPVNGSANVAWTLGEIGAVNKAGDTMTGNLTVPNLTVNGTITGNASSATKLQTARQINGTNFDGTANITTANWGTSRNITIGNTTKPVNGSANVTWTLGEIGIVQNTDFVGPRGNWSTNGDQDLLVHGKRALVGTTGGILYLGFGGDFTDIRCGNNWTVWHSNNFNPDTKLGAVNKNGYWGMTQPNGDENNWIRTTASGLLPHSSNGAAGHSASNTDIGTTGWRFRTIYAHSADFGGTLRAGGTANLQGNVNVGGGIYINQAGNTANGWVLANGGNYSLIAPVNNNANQWNQAIRHYSNVVAGGPGAANSYQFIGHVVPPNPTTYSIGHTNARWQDVYCTRGAFNGSDSSLKENIVELKRVKDTRTLNEDVASEDFYDYVKNFTAKTFNYKNTSENFVGIIADEIPAKVFDKIGVISKSEEKYLEEVEHQTKMKAVYDSSRDDFSEEDYENNIFIEEAGMTLSDLEMYVNNDIEEPVRLINAPAQVAMLQEVLSVALNKIDLLEGKLRELTV